MQIVADRLPDQPVEADRLVVGGTPVLLVDRHNEGRAARDQLDRQRRNDLAGRDHFRRRRVVEVGRNAAGKVNAPAEQGRSCHHASSMTGDARMVSAAAFRCSNLSASSGNALAMAAG